MMLCDNAAGKRSDKENELPLIHIKKKYVDGTILLLCHVQLKGLKPLEAYRNNYLVYYTTFIRLY